MAEERLQKIIAQAGLASRRGAEEMIRGGRVSINKQVVRQLGTKADIARDEIRLDGLLICPEVEKTYLMLNKPSGYVTTLHDPRQRHIVTELLPLELGRLFPVGRLDYDSEGLLIMTNDGDFAQQLMHPRFRIPKTYEVKIKGKLSPAELRNLLQGVPLSDGRFLPENLRVLRVNEKSTWLIMTLRSGKNRIIRRAFAALGYEVLELVRVSIGSLELGKLKTGEYNFLSPADRQKIFSFSKDG